MARMKTICLVSAVWFIGCNAIVSWDPDELPRDSGTDAPDVVDAVDTTDVQDDPDAMEDPVEDPIEDIVDDDAAGVCPPNTSTQLFVRVDGVVRNIQTDDPLSDVFVAAVAPTEALANPVSPPLLANAISESDGSFDLGCINVKEVNLGLIILVDDNPRDSVLGSLIPTGVIAKTWLTEPEKVDVRGVDVYALTSTLNAWIFATFGIDTNADGLVMGHVFNGYTDARLSGATVSRTVAMDVVYPTPDWSGPSTGGVTSTTGVFIIDDNLTLANITADLTGYIFGSYVASTVPDFCFYLPIEGTLE